MCIFFPSDSIGLESFKLCPTLPCLRVYSCQSTFDDIDLTLRSRVCRKHKLQNPLFVVLSTVFYTSYGCCTHYEYDARHDFCNCSMCSRETFFFWGGGRGGQVPGLIKHFNTGISSGSIHLSELHASLISHNAGRFSLCCCSSLHRPDSKWVQSKSI